MLKNKSAQIGTTITWFPAFIIIFFIMVLFVGASGILAAQKVAKAKDSISLSQISDNSKLNLEKELDFVLNSQVNGKTIKQEIIEWALNDLDDQVLINDLLIITGKLKIQQKFILIYKDSSGKEIKKLVSENTENVMPGGTPLSSVEPLASIQKDIFLGSNLVEFKYGGSYE